jgi:hypothetical protein
VILILDENYCLLDGRIAMRVRWYCKTKAGTKCCSFWLARSRILMKDVSFSSVKTSSSLFLLKNMDSPIVSQNFDPLNGWRNLQAESMWLERSVALIFWMVKCCSFDLMLEPWRHGVNGLDPILLSLYPLPFFSGFRDEYDSGGWRFEWVLCWTYLGRQCSNIDGWYTHELYLQQNIHRITNYYKQQHTKTNMTAWIQMDNTGAKVHNAHMLQYSSTIAKQYILVSYY